MAITTLYSRLEDHEVTPPVNPDESLSYSLRDRLVRFKGARR